MVGETVGESDGNGRDKRVRFFSPLPSDGRGLAEHVDLCLSNIQVQFAAGCVDTRFGSAVPAVDAYG